MLEHEGRSGSHSLEEVRPGYVGQVQANVLELAGNFLLRTKERTRETRVSVHAPYRRCRDRGEVQPGEVPRLPSHGPGLML